MHYQSEVTAYIINTLYTQLNIDESKNLEITTRTPRIGLGTKNTVT